MESQQPPAVFSLFIMLISSISKGSYTLQQLTAEWVAEADPGVRQGGREAGRQGGRQGGREGGKEGGRAH